MLNKLVLDGPSSLSLATAIKVATAYMGPGEAELVDELVLLVDVLRSGAGELDLVSEVADLEDVSFATLAQLCLEGMPATSDTSPVTTRAHAARLHSMAQLFSAVHLAR